MFLELIQLCFEANNSAFKELLNVSSGAKFEVRRNFDSQSIYRFDATISNGILEMSGAHAERVVQNASGDYSYCKITWIKREGGVIGSYQKLVHD